MRTLAYYTHEDRRHADMQRAECTWQEVTAGLAEWAHLFEVPLKAVEPVATGFSTASIECQINLDVGDLNWLTAAHEMAHVIDFKMCGLLGRRQFPAYWRAHSTRHALIVELLIAHLKSERWHRGALRSTK